MIPPIVPSEEFLSLDWERLIEDEDGFHAVSPLCLVANLPG